MSLSRTRLRTKFLEPLEDIGWLTHEPDPTDGRRVIFVKCKIEGESGETMGISDRSYFQEIFPAERLEKYMGELEKIWNHNAKCVRGNCEREGNGYSWFFSEKVPYFLEEHNGVNAKRKDENLLKCESSINGHTLQEKKEECRTEQQRLLDQYDEETVLLQIPQEDTRFEDVVKKFEDLNKVITTIFVLKEKGKVITGQGYIRRLCRSNNLITQYDEETVLQMIPEDDIKIRDFVDRFENPNKVVDTLLILEKKGEIIASQDCMRKATTTETDPDAPEPLNTWTCGICGVTFKAHIPYEDYSGHAICECCWRNFDFRSSG